MSEALEIEQQDHEAPETGLLCRTFAAEMSVGDGRTVDVRIVPYGEQITHNDGLGGVPKGVAYREEWAPGAFAHQVNAANRVLANFEHHEGLAGVIGHGVALRESDDGFHGSFRIHESPDGDKALTLIREKVLETVSVEAYPVKSIKTAAGVVRRVKANMVAVAFTRFGAYKGARILAVREEPESLIDEELLPVDLDPELVERLRASGVVLPNRYQAHPDTEGTPATTGTPDDEAPAPTDTSTSEKG